MSRLGNNESISGGIDHLIGCMEELQILLGSGMSKEENGKTTQADLMLFYLDILKEIESDTSDSSVPFPDDLEKDLNDSAITVELNELPAEEHADPQWLIDFVTKYGETYSIHLSTDPENKYSLIFPCVNFDAVSSLLDECITSTKTDKRKLDINKLRLRFIHTNELTRLLLGIKSSELVDKDSLDSRLKTKYTQISAESIRKYMKKGTKKELAEKQKFLLEQVSLALEGICRNVYLNRCRSIATECDLDPNHNFRSDLLSATIFMSKSLEEYKSDSEFSEVQKKIGSLEKLRVSLNGLKDKFADFKRSLDTPVIKLCILKDALNLSMAKIIGGNTASLVTWINYCMKYKKNQLKGSMQRSPESVRSDGFKRGDKFLRELLRVSLSYYQEYKKLFDILDSIFNKSKECNKGEIEYSDFIMYCDKKKQIIGKIELKLQVLEARLEAMMSRTCSNGGNKLAKKILKGNAGEYSIFLDDITSIINENLFGMKKGLADKLQEVFETPHLLIDEEYSCQDETKGQEVAPLVATPVATAAAASATSHVAAAPAAPDPAADTENKFKKELELVLNIWGKNKGKGKGIADAVTEAKAFL
jgi:hypothetical protein